MAPTDPKKTVPAFGGRAHASPSAAELGSSHGSRPQRQADPTQPGPAVAPGRTGDPARLEDGLEVQIHRAEGVPQPIEKLSRRFAELWTRNSVYVLDSGLRCIRVYEPESGKQEADHPFVGARLAGGQRNEGKMVVMSYPLPERGAAAVFESERGGKRMYSRTSAVERVVLHTSVIAIADEHGAPSWEVITGSP